MRLQRLAERRPTTRRLLILALPVAALSAMISGHAWARAAYLMNAARPGFLARVAFEVLVWLSLFLYLVGAPLASRGHDRRHQRVYGWIGVTASGVVSALPALAFGAVFSMQQLRGRSWPDLPLELTDFVLFGGASAGLLAVAAIAALRPRDPGSDAQVGTGDDGERKT